MDFWRYHAHHAGKHAGAADDLSVVNNARHRAVRFEYGNLCRSRPVSLAAWVASATVRPSRLQPPTQQLARRARAATDKQQKNAILNDAGFIATLEVIERRVYRRHGEDY